MSAAYLTKDYAELVRAARDVVGVSTDDVHGDGSLTTHHTHNVEITLLIIIILSLFNVTEITTPYHHRNTAVEERTAIVAVDNTIDITPNNVLHTLGLGHVRPWDPSPADEVEGDLLLLDHKRLIKRGLEHLEVCTKQARKMMRRTRVVSMTQLNFRMILSQDPPSTCTCVCVCLYLCACACVKVHVYVHVLAFKPNAKRSGGVGRVQNKGISCTAQQLHGRKKACNTHLHELLVFKVVDDVLKDISIRHKPESAKQHNHRDVLLDVRHSCL